MDISEWIGFLISALAIAYLFLRQVSDLFFRVKHPEEYKKREMEEAKRLDDLWRTLEADDEEENLPQLPKPVKPPPPRTLPKPSLAPKKVVHAEKVRYGHRTYSPQRVASLLTHLRSPKDIIVLKEVLGPPRAAVPIRHHESWD